MAKKISPTKKDSFDASPLGLAYNARFTENTKADLKIIDDAYEKSIRKFSIIFANKEITVYKILHYLHDKYDLSPRQIKTVDGLALESYFDPFAKHAANMIRMEHLVNEGILRDIGNKWLVIPNMSNQWTGKLAYFVWNEIREKGCLGMIFHSSGLNNFGEILINETYLDVIQFPKEICKNLRKIDDDGF